MIVYYNTFAVCGQQLLVVRNVVCDCGCSVELFGKHNAAKLVRQCDFAETHAQIGSIAYLVGKSVASADYKRKHGSRLFSSLDFLGKLPTCQLFASNIQHYHAPFALGKQSRALGLKYFLYFFVARRPAEKALVRFHHLDGSKTRQSLDILCQSFAEILFFNFAYGYDFEFQLC